MEISSFVKNIGYVLSILSATLFASKVLAENRQYELLIDDARNPSASFHLPFSGNLRPEHKRIVGNNLSPCMTNSPLSIDFAEERALYMPTISSFFGFQFEYDKINAHILRRFGPHKFASMYDISASTEALTSYHLRRLINEHSLEYAEIPPHYMDFLISLCSGGGNVTFPPKFNPRLVPLYDRLWDNTLDRFDGLQDSLESEHLIDNSKLFGGFLYPNSPALIAGDRRDSVLVSFAMVGGTYDDYITVIDEVSNYWLNVSQSGSYSWRDYLFLVNLSMSPRFSDYPFSNQYPDDRLAKLPFTNSEGVYVAGGESSLPYSRGIFQLGLLANTLIADLGNLKQALELAQISAHRNNAIIDFSQQRYLGFLETHYTRNPNSFLSSGTLPASDDQWGNPGFNPLSSIPPAARAINRDDLQSRSVTAANAFAGISTSLAWLNARIYYETSGSTPHTLFGANNLTLQQKNELQALVGANSDLINVIDDQRLMLRSCLLFAVRGLALEQRSVQALKHIFSLVPSDISTRSGLTRINTPTVFSSRGDCELYPESSLESTLLNSNPFLGSTAPEELYAISVFRKLSEDRQRYAEALRLSVASSSELGPHLSRVTAEDKVLLGIKRIAEASILTSFSGRLIEPNASYFPTHVWPDIGHFHSDGGGYSMVFQSSGNLRQLADVPNEVTMDHLSIINLTVSGTSTEILGLYSDWSARAENDDGVHLNLINTTKPWEGLCSLDLTDMRLLGTGRHALLELSYNGTCNEPENFEPPYFNLFSEQLDGCIADLSQCSNFDLGSSGFQDLLTRTPIDQIREGVGFEFTISFTD